MMTFFARATLIAVALALAGCNESLEDIAPKAEHQLPASIVKTMKARGMSRGSPIMMRIFKEEGVLEVWKQKDNGRFGQIASYDICKWSGKLGPKFTEGDRQAPEGFYSINSYQMNPNSSYYLSFNIGYPNRFDQAHGRTGSNLMVHGACSSAGCYSMTDEQVADIYAFARDAFEGGQRAFQVQALPFRMTARNMARYRGDPNYDFWKMLKEGYDYFEITKVPPKVDVCNGGYVFNRVAEPGHDFQASAACPPSSQPERLRMAYRSYQTTYEAAFSAALNSGPNETKPSIAGVKEASLVADWSRRRARGERVSREPPSLTAIAEAEKPANATATTIRTVRTGEAAPKTGASESIASARAEQRRAAPAAPREQTARNETETDAIRTGGTRPTETKSDETAANAVPLPRPAPAKAERTASSEKGAIGRILGLFGG